MADTNNATMTVNIVPGPGTYSAHLGAVLDRDNTKSKELLAREIADAHHTAQYRTFSYWMQFPKAVLCVVHADIYGWAQT